MLGHRLRRWPNIKSTLGQLVMFAAMSIKYQGYCNAFVMIRRVSVSCLFGIELLLRLNHLKPEFTIVIFIRYKPRITVAILDL